jgi:hypothetical protein
MTAHPLDDRRRGGPRVRAVCTFCGHPVGRSATTPGGRMRFREHGHWLTAHTSCWVAAQSIEESAGNDHRG